MILLLSMDFWTVKNITGRLLVGLRWWNYVDDNGKSHWVYESRKGNMQNRIHPGESQIFWGGLVAFPAVWTIFFLVSLFGLSFKWMLVVSIALVFHGANLYGYIKCRFGSEKNMSSNVTEFFRRQVIQNVANIMSRPTQPSTNAANATSVIWCFLIFMPFIAFPILWFYLWPWIHEGLKDWKSWKLGFGMDFYHGSYHNSRIFPFVSNLGLCFYSMLPFQQNCSGIWFHSNSKGQFSVSFILVSITCTKKEKL